MAAACAVREELLAEAGSEPPSKGGVEALVEAFRRLDDDEGWQEGLEAYTSEAVERVTRRAARRKSGLVPRVAQIAAKPPTPVKVEAAAASPLRSPAAKHKRAWRSPGGTSSPTRRGRRPSKTSPLPAGGAGAGNGTGTRATAATGADGSGSGPASPATALARSLSFDLLSSAISSASSELAAQE